MSGVLAKIFQAAPASWKTMASGEVVSAAGYSVLCSLTTLVVTGLLLLTVFRKKPYEQVQTKRGVLVGLAIALASGSVNGVGNWILQMALEVVETSVQYPMVTGGTMIVTTVIAFCTKNKPHVREVLSVVLATVGLGALFVFPNFLPAWDIAIFKL